MLLQVTNQLNELQLSSGDCLEALCVEQVFSMLLRAPQEYVPRTTRLLLFQKGFTAEEKLPEDCRLNKDYVDGDTARAKTVARLWLASVMDSNNVTYDDVFAQQGVGRRKVHCFSLAEFVAS